MERQNIMYPSVTFANKKSVFSKMTDLNGIVNWVCSFFILAKSGHKFKINIFLIAQNKNAPTFCVKVENIYSDSKGDAKFLLRSESFAWS